MSSTIEVSKQLIIDFLKTGAENLLVIPEYQREYSWGTDKVQELFNDLLDFTVSINTTKQKGSTYFLGCIVSYKNANNEQEIIDGQQRITSMILFLRAIYTMLDSMSTASEDIRKHLMSQIVPAIWVTDDLTGKPDLSSMLIESRVISNDGNRILKNILSTGKSEAKAKDNYSLNYIKLQDLLSELSGKEPLLFNTFISNILMRTIVLPIAADTQDTALTIFTTLNDRGLPLTDADIFKSKIYSHLRGRERDDFINRWMDLDEQAKEASETLQSLFYYCMFYIRARKNDSNSTTPGARKYYLANDCDSLFDPQLMANLESILVLWRVVNCREQFEDESWSSDNRILQALDILSSYPNEFWKYPVVCYYLTYRSIPLFENNFLSFLRQLITELLTRYLLNPTINAVRVDILKLNVAIIESPQPEFRFKSIDTTQLDEKIKIPHNNAVRMLLKIIAYNVQDDLLPAKWEVEHILPQKWQSSYFPHDYSEEFIIKSIEHIGNKLPFEKRLNIKASNGYFDQKKKEYGLSRVAIVNEMLNSHKADWTINDIFERDIYIVNTVRKTFSDWRRQYTNGVQEEDKPPYHTEKKELRKGPEPSLHVLIFCKKRGTDASGYYYSKNKVLILAGSIVSDTVSNSFKKDNTRYYRLRLKLEDIGVISNNTFTKDYMFSSASEASSVILGSSSSGAEDFQLADGRHLRDIMTPTF